MPSADKEQLFQLAITSERHEEDRLKNLALKSLSPQILQTFIRGQYLDEEIIDLYL